jgi:formate dehydrogenase subunit gamma
MKTAIERFDEKARRLFSHFGQTIVRRGELLRFPLYTRFLHWMVALFFILSLLSGFAIYSPHLFHWLTPLFGGGPTTRLLHPWLGLGFNVFFFFQFLNWFVPMAWTNADGNFMRHVRDYAANREKLNPEETGYFNGGQKLYFWAITLSALLFLITGILLWLDQAIPRGVIATSYVIHDIAALIMLGGFMIHVYQTTASEPGTFRAMISGTVTEAWAWTHHPAWYRLVTGRDPRVAYEQALKRQAERNLALEAWEREQDAHEQPPTLPSTEQPKRI